MTAFAAHAPHLRRDSLLFVLCLSLSLAVLVYPGVASAAIYKCVDNLGNTTYSGAPCADHESTQRISKSAAVVPGMDCRVARKFAADAVTRMQAGESSHALFDSYGGVDSTTPFVKNLVSYVYSFEGSQDVSQSRLTTLSTQRCEAGSFGSVGRRCDAFPLEFLERHGGCELIRGEPARGGPTPIGSAVSGSDGDKTASANNRFPSQHAAFPSLGEANPARSNQYVNPVTGTARTPKAGMATAGTHLRTECQTRLTSNIGKIREQMNEAQDATSQDRLTQRARKLRSELTRC